MGFRPGSIWLCVSVVLGFAPVAPVAQTSQNARLVPQLGHSGAVASMAFSPDGRYILTASGMTAQLWETASRRQLRQFVGHTEEVDSVAFSPDGLKVLTGSVDGTARIWDVETGKQLQIFGIPEGEPQPDLEAKVDGCYVASTTFVYFAAFSQDGKSVLASGHDHNVIVWDAATGKGLRCLQGHEETVTRGVFSPDGTRALTGSYDHTVRL